MASDEETARIESSFLRLLDFYEIAYRAYVRDSETGARRIQAFRQNAEPNAYYDWVLGR